MGVEETGEEGKAEGEEEEEEEEVVEVCKLVGRILEMRCSVECTQGAGFQL